MILKQIKIWGFAAVTIALLSAILIGCGKTAAPGTVGTVDASASASIELKIYGYNAKTDAEEEYKYVAPKERADDLYLPLEGYNIRYVKEILNNESGIQVNEITRAGSKLAIDFKNSIYDFNLGSGSEAELLKMLAKTYIENVKGIDAVYISVNGAAYESGHILQRLDEPIYTAKDAAASTGK